MKKKSSNYNSPDGGGWCRKCDDLFLSRYRRLPCEICGAQGGWDGKQKASSCGHHLIFKGSCRKHRYEPKNIVVLCPKHHSHYEKHISPHSIVSTDAQAAFEKWVHDNKPFQYEWWMEHQRDMDKPFNKTWCYREKYIELGGEVHSKTGNLKDLRVKNHKAKIDANMGKTK